MGKKTENIEMNNDFIDKIKYFIDEKTKNMPTKDRNNFLYMMRWVAYHEIKR